MDIDLYNTTLTDIINDMIIAGVAIDTASMARATMVSRSVALGLLSLDDC
jgi:hypothetical protein